MQAPPALIVSLDVETTGFHSRDRIVSLGAWRIDTQEKPSNSFACECLHLIVDPGKKSHPKAEQVHGYSDWTLRHQDPFSDHAKVVSAFLSEADLVVAHNASFDLKFIEREYRALGQEPPAINRYCTMEGYRRRGTGSAALAAICNEIGLARAQEKHGALEDAWLAFMVYCWLENANMKLIPFAEMLAQGAPETPLNFVSPPPLPEGPLPRRPARISVPEPREQAGGAASVARAELLAAVRPTAILLLEIARADDHFAAEEVDVLVNLIRTMRDRLHLPLDGEAEMEILAELFDTKLSQNLLTRSAGALCKDPIARAAFPKWFATLVRADGKVSPAEQAGIDRVKGAISRAMSKIAQ